MLQAPQVAVAHGETEARIDDAGGAELLRAHQANALEMVGIVLAAIRNTEKPLRRTTRVDHPLAFLNGDLHRLLAEDMLAGLCRGNRLVAVLGVGGHDVEDVDVRVVGQLPDRVVRIDAVIRDSIPGLPLPDLVGRPGDDAGQPAVFGFEQCRSDLVLAQAPKAAEREADLPARAPRLSTGH